MPTGRIVSRVPRYQGGQFAAPGAFALADYWAQRRARALRQLAQALDTTVLSPFFNDHFYGGALRSEWVTTPGVGGTIGILDDVNGILRLKATSTGSNLISFNIYRPMRYALDAAAEFRVRVPDRVERRIRCGLMGQLGTAVPTRNFVYFENDATASAVNWFAKCDKGGTTTTVNTNVASTVGFVYLLLKMDSLRGQVAFYTKVSVNDAYVRRAVITTNIPTVRLQPVVEQTGTGTAPITHLLDIDLVRLFSSESENTAVLTTIAFRSVATNTALGATTLTVTKPTGTVADDVMVAHIYGGAVNVTVVPTGWTELSNNNAYGRYVSYYKVAGTAEPADYTWTVDFATDLNGSIRSYTGVDNLTPTISEGVLISVVNGPATNFATASGLLNDYTDSMLVTFFAANTNVTWTPPGGETERFDINATFAASGADETQADVGAIPVKTGVASSSVGGGGYAEMITLRQA